MATIAKYEKAPISNIHGDILETILSQVPLLYLLPATQVSKTWNEAVLSSLHFNKIKPWLLVHTQSIRPPHATSTHAYDPRSDLWIEINNQIQSEPSINYQIGNLHSSHSTLLYMLSPVKFVFSLDPLHLTWHEVDAPRVWRSDPIVALVGKKIVIAGGACDFEDDPLAVEMYDVDSCTWDTCQSMPEVLLDCAASWWLSTVVCGDKLYLLEKGSGVVHCFDPSLKLWSGPYDFCPDKRFYHVEFGCVDNDRLIIIGLCGDSSNLEKVIIWEVDCKSHDNGKLLFKEIGEMPKEMVKKLKGESYRVTSVTVNMMGNFLYIHNPAAPEEIIVSEMVVNGEGTFGGEWKWSSVRNIVVNDRTRIMHKFVFTCGNVGLGELANASKCENWKFSVAS
ncbi:hypothetical protein ACFE04_023077 [Oxalis oulophora]